MSRRWRTWLTRVTAFMLVLVLCTTEAFAVVKDVSIGGAWSINDLGQSDNRVTMDQLKEDYHSYKQTNWLTEYFHKDQEAPGKVDLGEAVSWLIDNEVINRDMSVTIGNIYPYNYSGNNGVPTVTIQKADVTDYIHTSVHRSDMIMYLYKAVFGSVDARTVGVEVPNIRVDNGTKMTLYKMMDNHDYFETISTPTGGIVQQEATGGDNQVSQVCIWSIPHTDRQTVTSTGGVAGTQQVSYEAINTSSRWRYTPQGDEYESMFGDTNIFISDVDIAQQANTGAGSQNAGFVDNEANSSSNTSNTGSAGDVDYNGTLSDGHNQQQGQVQGSGGINAAISYETDYKQIYYVPGADLMFYRADDCVELYIQYALSKGLLASDPVLKTDKYQDVFISDYSGTAGSTPARLNIWSPVAPAHIVNRNYSILNDVTTNVKSYSDTCYNRTGFAGPSNPNRMNNVLGENYNVQYVAGYPSTLTISRNNIFQSNTGYFDSEIVSRFQLYKYIFDFIGGSEKKLSSLETEIINYKYGLQLDSLGTEQEVYILKYLIAMGILDYTDMYDFQNLDAAIDYGDFFTILYRVANPNARLDFSKVQLTDSETQWQAMGYGSQKVALTQLETSHVKGYTKEEPDVEYSVPEDTPLAVVYYNEDSDYLVDSAVSLLDSVVLNEVASEESTTTETAFGATPVEYVVGESFSPAANSIHDITFSFRGAYVSPSKNTENPHAFMTYNVANNALIKNTDFASAADTTADNDSTNPSNYWQNILNYYITECLASDAFLDYFNNNSGDYNAKKIGGPRSFFAGFYSANNVDIGKASELTGVPFVDMYYYFLTNVYVIALFRTQDGMIVEFNNYCNTLRDETTASDGWFGDLINWFTGEDRYKKIRGNLIDCVQQTFNEYVTDGGGKAPSSITFVLDSHTNYYGGGDYGTAASYSNAYRMGRGDSWRSLAAACSGMGAIKIGYRVNGESTLQNWTLRRTSGFPTASDYYGNLDDGGATAALLWEKADSASKWSVIMESAASGEDGAMQEFTRAMGRLDYNAADALNLTLEVQAPTDSTDFGGFVSWGSLKNNFNLLQIEQIGDCILHNKITDTYAYFPPEGVDYKYALVGNALVEGHPDEGVAKMMNGQYWYWFDAVRLLIGIEGESSILDGMQGVKLPAKSVTMHTQNIPVISESGFQGSSVNTLRFRLGDNQTLMNGMSGLSEETQNFIKSQPSTDGSRWANYVAASTSNRVLNMVYRKVTYSVGNHASDKQIAFACIFLRPTNDITGSALLTEEMSLEDTLDAIAREPADESSRAKWLANKQLVNDCLNWLYGTAEQEYVNTGYLIPKIYIYAETRTDAQSIPADAFGPLTDAMQAESGLVQYGGLNAVKDGMVCDPGLVTESALSYDPDTDDANSDENYVYGSIMRPPKSDRSGDEEYRAAYYLSDDYRVAVIGDRLMVHEKYIPGLVGFVGRDTNDSDAIRYRYQLVNRAVKGVVFYPGQTFTLGKNTSTSMKVGVPMPKITVISMENGGKVTAQVGPICGVPFRRNGSIAVIHPDLVLSTKPYKEEDRDDTLVPTLMEDVNVNMWKYVKEKMFAGDFSGITWKNTVVSSPNLTSQVGRTRYAVWDGSTIKVFDTSSASNDQGSWSYVGGIKSGGMFSSAKTYIAESLSTYGFPGENYLKEIETYAEIEFSAYDYVVRQGSLFKANNGSGIMAGDVFSPSLFVSINDMIIEQMIYDSKAAIPLNQVPEGAFVQVGEGWFIAANADENDKKFVGYTPLSGFTTLKSSPRIQEAAMSMSTHFVRGGNQYINIVHYMTDFVVLDSGQSGEADAYATWEDIMKPIGVIKLKDAKLSQTPRFVCPARTSTVYGIDNGISVSSNLSPESLYYAPVLIQFNNLLSAYPITTDEEHPTYKICNFAKNSAAGALDSLPFFAKDVLEAGLNDVTTTVSSGSYIKYGGARYLMDEFTASVQKAFAGDLLTLARLLVFVILIWLFVMSWVCYGFYWSRLMPMVDAICHPTRDGGAKGIDLFKIFTLGTISVDSDFKLGRFLQYDFIIAILILTVWKSGSLTFG